VPRFLLIALLAAACNRGTSGEAAATRSGSDSAGGSGSAAVLAAAEGPCKAVPFAVSTPVPEASGAAWLTLEGKPALVVVSDSGNDGAYAIVDPETGETREQGKLPLGEAGEDIEGLASRGDKIYGLTSSGWMRVWVRSGAGFELAEAAYPIGPVDLPDKSGGNKPPKGDGMVCGAKATNCGRNYEGLCLVDTAHAKGPCAGYAASKADGHLYCLIEQDGKLLVQHATSIEITRPGALADCAFSADDGTLWAGSNLFDLSQVYRIDGWADPATAKVVAFAQIGVGFPETIAARGDVIYRMSDTGGSPSLMAKYRCKR
jgi:hypothetical protein